jgi:hypothetical protein
VTVYQATRPSPTPAGSSLRQGSGRHSLRRRRAHTVASPNGVPAPAPLHASRCPYGGCSEYEVPGCTLACTPLQRPGNAVSGVTRIEGSNPSRSAFSLSNKEVLWRLRPAYRSIRRHLPSNCRQTADQRRRATTVASSSLVFAEVDALLIALGGVSQEEIDKADKARPATWIPSAVLAWNPGDDPAVLSKAIKQVAESVSRTRQ